MNHPEVSKVSIGVKRGFDSRGVKSVTPYRGALTSDTPSDTAEVSEGFDTRKTWFALTLRPEPGNWKTPPEARLRAALKALLRGYGLRCTSATETPAPTKPPTPAL